MIASILERHQDRANVRNTIVGNLNYVLSASQKLPPRFPAYSLKDLANEKLWFDEKVRLKEKVFHAHLTREERSLVLDAYQRIEALRQCGEQALKTADESWRIARRVLALGAANPCPSLLEALEYYRYADVITDTNELSRQVGECLSRLASMPSGHRQLLQDLCDVLQEHVRARHNYDQALADLEKQVSSLRHKVWAES